MDSGRYQPSNKARQKWKASSSLEHTENIPQVKIFLHTLHTSHWTNDLRSSDLTSPCKPKNCQHCQENNQKSTSPWLFETLLWYDSMLLSTLAMIFFWAVAHNEIWALQFDGFHQTSIRIRLPSNFRRHAAGETASLDIQIVNTIISASLFRQCFSNFIRGKQDSAQCMKQNPNCLIS